MGGENRQNLWDETYIKKIKSSKAKTASPVESRLRNGKVFCSKIRGGAMHFGSVSCFVVHSCIIIPETWTRMLCICILLYCIFKMLWLTMKYCELKTNLLGYSKEPFRLFRNYYTIFWKKHQNQKDAKFDVIQICFPETFAITISTFMINNVKFYQPPVNVQGSLWLKQSSCNIGYPSEIHHKIKYPDNPFIRSIQWWCNIIVNYCREHGGITSSLPPKFWIHQATEK